MTRLVLYVAAPLRPTEDEIAEIPMRRVERGRGEYEPDTWHPVPDAERVALALRANLERAMRWLSWLRRSFQETTFIAPWIVDILSGADDSDETQREAGMQGNFAVIERCDGIVLCGPRISEGMRREMEHGCRIPVGKWHPWFWVHDLTGAIALVPEHRPDQPFAVWAGPYEYDR